MLLPSLRVKIGLQHSFNPKQSPIFSILSIKENFLIFYWSKMEFNNFMFQSKLLEFTTIQTLIQPFFFQISTPQSTRQTLPSQIYF